MCNYVVIHSSSMTNKPLTPATVPNLVFGFVLLMLALYFAVKN
jgi:hypothetical protein